MRLEATCCKRMEAHVMINAADSYHYMQCSDCLQKYAKAPYIFKNSSMLLAGQDTGRSPMYLCSFASAPLPLRPPSFCPEHHQPLLWAQSGVLALTGVSVQVPDDYP